MPITTGQIELDSPLGRVLAFLAGSAKTIVEIGTGSGLGSTQCLLAGASNDAEIYCIEGSQDQYRIAYQNLHDRRINLIRAILHRTIRPYFHPINLLQHKEMWEHECAIINDPATPVLTPDRLPALIDLLVLDGGEYTSDGDFLRLWPRVRFIVIDDCNPAVATKNAFALDCMHKSAWRQLHWEREDRNGWAVFERPLK
jgi:hypothetical protein